jgi:hypothetical protein
MSHTIDDFLHCLTFGHGAHHTISLCYLSGVSDTSIRVSFHIRKHYMPTDVFGFHPFHTAWKLECPVSGLRRKVDRDAICNLITAHVGVDNANSSLGHLNILLNFLFGRSGRAHSLSHLETAHICLIDWPMDD